MSDLLMFLTWFILGAAIGSFLANRRRHPGWTLADEARFWQNLIRGKR